MKKISFNKAEDTAICLFCNKERVPLADWNKRGPNCKAKLKVEQEKEEKNQSVIIGKRLPAAIINPDAAPEENVFVDKFGKETENPGYDLKNDPRGYGIRSKIKNKEIIK